MDIFKYANDNGEIQIGAKYYIIKPEKIDSKNRVRIYDETAERAIREATRLIEKMKEYRKALYVRFNEINEANYSLLLSVKRETNYRAKKYYLVTIKQIFDRKGISPDTVLFERYEGRERHRALAHFEELKKQYPNIQTEKDIDKKQWEK